MGSSTMISCGSPISAWAMPKRCFMPPENCRARCLRDVAEVGLLRAAPSTGLAPRPRSREALEPREVIEQIVRP